MAYDEFTLKKWGNEHEVFAVTITNSAETKPPVLLNLCTTRDCAKAFIAETFSDFKPMPSFQANADGELGTVYYHRGAKIHLKKMLVGFGIYQWLVGSENYRSPIMEAMA